MKIAKVWEIRLLDVKSDVTWGSTVPKRGATTMVAWFGGRRFREDIVFGLGVCSLCKGLSDEKVYGFKYFCFTKFASVLLNSVVTQHYVLESLINDVTFS